LSSNSLIALDELDALILDKSENPLVISNSKYNFASNSSGFSLRYLINLFSGLPAEMKPRKMKIDKTEKCCIVQLGDEDEEDKIG